MAGAQPIRESVRQHRRDTRRYIILPTVVVFLLLAGGLGAVLVRLRWAQVSIVSDFALTIMVLCPMVLCFLPVTIISVVAVFGMNRAHDAMKRPFYRLEDYSKAMVERTETVTGQVNRQTINISARFGAVYKLLSILEPPEESSDE
jgi:membrane protein implicated in regulation of membrane protease activity